MVFQFEKDKDEMKKFFANLSVRPNAIIDLWKGMVVI